MGKEPVRVTIRRRLQVIGLLATGAAVLAMGVALLAARWELGRRQLLDALASEAAIVARHATTSVEVEDRAGASATLSDLRGAPGVAQAAIYGENGALFARWDRERQGDLLPPRAASADILPDGSAVAYVDLGWGARSIGTLYVRSDARALRAHLVDDASAIALAGAGALLLAFLLLSRLQRSIEGPVRELAQVIGRAAALGDYSSRASVDAGGELGALATGLNGMLDGLERREQERARHREGLEQEAAHRTEQLAAANRRLQEELAERGRAEAALERSAQDWSATFDALREGVLVLDRSGAIRRCNRAILALVGRRMEEVEGGELGELLPQWCNCRLSDVRSLSGRQTASWKFAGRTYEARLEPMLGASGDHAGWVQVLVDVTEQKRLQTQFAQSQKMEAIGRLAGGVAHDFNNILAAILSYARLLLEDMPPEDPLRDDVQEIKKAAERAAALTRQLLAFSRKQVLTPEVLRVCDLVADMARMMGRVVGEQIDLALRAEGTGCALIDKSQLEQALVNLVLNARDAMPEGGRLTIEVADVELDESEARAKGDATPGPYVRLTVEDTGTGMSEETLKKLFEPFFTTKLHGRGTGLGLAMVYGAVRQAGGRVTVKSAPGTGSCFSIFLPRVSAAAPKVPAAEGPPRGKGEPILLVEDDAPLRRALSRLLENAGYRVHTAADGEEAYRLFLNQGEGIQLVVTDVIMPGTGGLALGERLRARRSEMPILYITGYSEEILRARQPPGKAAVLYKPFEDAALLARVRELLDGGWPGARAAG
jgi:PAS domain S-box-containing protein